MALRKLALGVTGTLLLVGVAGVASPGVASAAVQQGIGFAVTAQPYKGNPDTKDWLGSYIVNGQQVWCVDFALNAPQSNQQYTDGTTLTTKFGKPLDPTVAAEISYLLLRFGNTKSADDAAAMAHLLHMWTAAPTSSAQLDPTTNGFATIAYDAPTHLKELPASTQTAVATLQADAAANHGPWTTSMTAPTTPQVIGTAGNWTVNVLSAAGKGLANVPVTITATDATLTGGSTSEVVNTPADGSPLTVAATANGPNPKLVATLQSPSAIPRTRVPVAPNVQKVVTTGGMTPLTSQATTTAETPPGKLIITKTDATTKKPIAGVTLEVTGPDKKNPAIEEDGKPLTGTDGKALVVTTSSNGTATVTDLHTPQQVCLIETAPPPGYDQAFNPAAPPSVCGEVEAGKTVQVSLTNVPNKVPVAIPAGGPPPTMTAASVVLNQPAPGALVAFGGLLVIAAGCTGLVAARRASRRRR